MTDHTEDRLRTALHERGERIAPTPALPGILHRANAARRPAWRRWRTVSAAALASGGLIAAVIVVGPDWYGEGPVKDPVDQESTAVSDPTVEAPEGEPVTVPAGTVVPMALHFITDYEDGALVSGEFEVSSSGDIGVDAAQVLIERDPGAPFVNGWLTLTASSDADPIRVRSVRRSADLITVDFNGAIDVDCPPGADCAFPDGELVLQQLVYTMQSVLRSDAPVLITVNGQPADEAFGVALDGPLEPDPTVAPSIRIAAPAQGATVSSPVVVTGESTAFEGTVQWAVLQDGEPVQSGITMGGSMGEFAPFEVRVDLPPGDYTIAMWEENMAGGSEGLARRLSPVYLDLTVQ